MGKKRGGQRGKKGKGGEKEREKGALGGCILRFLLAFACVPAPRSDVDERGGGEWEIGQREGKKKKKEGGEGGGIGPPRSVVFYSPLRAVPHEGGGKKKSRRDRRRGEEKKKRGGGKGACVRRYTSLHLCSILASFAP